MGVSHVVGAGILSLRRVVVVVAGGGGVVGVGGGSGGVCAGATARHGWLAITPEMSTERFS